MKYRKLTIATGALCLGVASAGAMAKDHGDWFNKLDSNHDGKITQAELDAAQSKRFKKTDTNGDGAIDLSEFQAQANKRTAAIFKRLDKNGDGKIEQSEAPHGKGNLMKRMDANGDGAISQEEWNNARQHRHHGHHKASDK